MEENEAAVEPALVDQLEIEPDVVGEHLLASAHDRRREEEVVLVDEPRLDRLAGETGTADGKVLRGFLLSRRTASGSNSRSSRVLPLATESSVLEKTILLAARQTSA